MADRKDGKSLGLPEGGSDLSVTATVAREDIVEALHPRSGLTPGLDRAENDKSERQTREEEAMASLMTDIALRADAPSASASTIQQDVLQTLQQVEEETQHHNGSHATSVIGEKESESDVVVVMNVALKVEGVTKKEFHQMDPERRAQLMSHLIDTNISANATVNPNNDDSTLGNESSRSGDQKNGNAEEGSTTNESERSADGSITTADNLDDDKATYGSSTNAEDDEGESQSQNADSDGVQASALEGVTGEGGNPSSDARTGGRGGGASSNAEADGMNQDKDQSAQGAARNRGAASFNAETGGESLAITTNADGEDDENDGVDDGDADGAADGDGVEADDPQENKASMGSMANEGSNQSITEDPKKAAELVGSLIGMENAINRDLSYDASKLVAFPPLWVSPGAKIVRQHEAELNWKDRMQDWETQKPERPTIYKIAIRDNLVKLGNKDYGCINHGYRTTCIGYVDKVHVKSEYEHYEDVPTPKDYPTFGKGLVPRKQEQDIQAQRAKQRYQPFGLKDVYQKNQFVLGKNVPYYCRKQKPPKNPNAVTRLPSLGKQIAKHIQDDKGHQKHSVMGGKTRIDDLARPHQYNTCKSYFPKEYMTSFKDPKDQICFKEVAMFLPQEERDKVNRTEDMWPRSAREKKKGKKREMD